LDGYSAKPAPSSTDCAAHLDKPELADEVMREVYLKVWDNAENFDAAIATPATRMMALARKLAIDFVHKDGGLLVAEMPDAAHGAEAPPPLARGEMTDELRALLACLGKLDLQKTAHRAARPLQRLGPRAIGAQARHPGEHNEDLAALLAARNPRPHGVSVGRSVLGVSAAASGGA
jgi:DNA-directed RNA polymerase specialized sigma24 family protein